MRSSTIRATTPAIPAAWGAYLPPKLTMALTAAAAAPPKKNITVQDGEPLEAMYHPEPQKASTGDRVRQQTLFAVVGSLCPSPGRTASEGTRASREALR